MSDVRFLKPSALSVAVASTPVVGQWNRGVVLVEDQCGRALGGAHGEIVLNTSLAVQVRPRAVVLDARNPGWARFEIRPMGPTAGTVEATLADHGLSSESNPFSCTGKDDQTLLWGDLHQHSTLSDGLGSPEENYRYARDVARLDFCAIADHDIWPHPFTDHEWVVLCDAARTFNSPGKFVTFLGYEWDASRNGYGHMNVYYLNDDEPVFTSEDARSDTPEKLFACLAGRDATVIVHHPAATKDGWFTTNWDHFDADLEALVEVHSMWGSSECSREDGNTHPIERLGGLASHGAGCFVRDALDRGYRLGLIGGSDGHDGRPGRSQLYRLPKEEDPSAYTADYPPYCPSGIQGVWADGCTREAIWEAMLARRTYATTGHRPIVRFSINGHPMGSEIDLSNEETCDVSVDVTGTAAIDRIDIIRNGQCWQTVAGASQEEHARVEATRENDGDYFYARILQTDGNAAWTSPIWVDWTRRS